MARVGHPRLDDAADRLGHIVLRPVGHNEAHPSNPILKLSFSGNEEHDPERERVTS